MNLKRIFPTLIFPAVSAIASYGQTIVTIPKAFIETSPPKVRSDEWRSLNNSSNEFSVKIIDGKLDIKKVKEEKKCTLKIKGGTLIGINRGEWGGQLTFESDDTTKKVIVIKQGNIKFIFHFKDKIYFIEGLAHMSFNNGAIFELDTTNNNFIFTKLVDFDDAPEAFAIYKDKFLIATYENFYIVQDFKKELVLKETFWSSLYPNSIAVLDDENVFIGIRGGIVKLDLTTKILKFYKNNK